MKVIEKITLKYYVNIIYNTMLINIRMARYGRSRKSNKKLYYN